MCGHVDAEDYRRIIPIIPFEFGDVKKRSGSGNGYPLPFKCSPDKDVQNKENVGQEEERSDRVSTYHSHYQVTNENDLLNVGVVSYVITRVLQMNDCWNSIKNQTTLTVLSMAVFTLETDNPCGRIIRLVHSPSWCEFETDNC